MIDMKNGNTAKRNQVNKLPKSSLPEYDMSKLSSEQKVHLAVFFMNTCAEFFDTCSENELRQYAKNIVVAFVANTGPSTLQLLTQLLSGEDLKECLTLPSGRSREGQPFSRFEEFLLVRNERLGAERN